MIFFKDPVGSLLLDSEEKRSSFRLCLLGFLLALIEAMFELLPLLVYLLLVFRHTSIALILDFLELQRELLFVLLSLCVSFLE